MATVICDPIAGLCPPRPPDASCEPIAGLRKAMKWSMVPARHDRQLSRVSTKIARGSREHGHNRDHWKMGCLRRWIEQRQLGGSGLP